MRRLVSLLAVTLTVGLLTGCASGPKYAEVSGSFKAATPDQARVYIYRTAMLGAAVQPEVRLDNKVVGKAVPGGFFYVDVEPGDHKIMTSTEVDRSLSFTADKGQTRYVKLNISMGFFVGHVYPELIDNPTGASEITQCSYTGSP